MVGLHPLSSMAVLLRQLPFAGPLQNVLDHLQCLGVVDELLHIQSVMHPSLLSLTAEEVLKGSWHILWLRNDVTLGCLKRYCSSFTNDLAMRNKQ